MPLVYLGDAASLEAARRYTRPDGQIGLCPPGTFYSYDTRGCAQLVGGKVPAGANRTPVLSTACPPDHLWDPVSRGCIYAGTQAVTAAQARTSATATGSAQAAANTAAADPGNAIAAAAAAATLEVARLEAARLLAAQRTLVPALAPAGTPAGAIPTAAWSVFGHVVTVPMMVGAGLAVAAVVYFLGRRSGG